MRAEKRRGGWWTVADPGTWGRGCSLSSSFLILLFFLSSFLFSPCPYHRQLEIQEMLHEDSMDNMRAGGAGAPQAPPPFGSAPAGGGSNERHLGVRVLRVQILYAKQ